MITGPPTLVSADATGEIVLIHTVLVAMSVGVTVTLLRTLLSLRRSGEALPGLLGMIWCMLATELLRAAWLVYAWLRLPAPLSIDILSFLTSFVVLVGVPIAVSSRYLPKEPAAARQPWLWAGLQRAMVVTALLGFAALVAAVGLQSRVAVLLAPAGTYVLIALFLLLRISSYRHLQVRRRPLLVFAAFMIAGLLLLSGVGIFSIVTGVRVRHSMPLASLNGAGLILVLCGVIFLFANLRLADLVVKRGVRIVLWTSATLLAWLAIVHVSSLHGRIGQAGEAILSLVLMSAAIGLAPAAERSLNRGIDKWVFEQPDLQAVTESLWREVLELGTREEVFSTTETFMRDVLHLAAVRVLPRENAGILHDFHPARPGPYFASASSNVVNEITPSAHIFFPLFVEGRCDYVIALSTGNARPALTLWELEFLERVAGRLQIWLGMQTAAEGARREALFREELASAELRALRAQVNPHFLFNSLNTIADLAVIAPSQAEEMTVRLSAVFRYVLVNTDRQFTSLKEELDFARSYLHIEQTRFGDRLKVIFDIDPAVMEQQIPTLLLQPLIENALKHGLAPRREGGTLTIRAKKDADAVRISVADDGVGLRERAELTERSTRVGVTNVSNRLKTSYGGRASFTLRKREQGGTEALIVIPGGREE